MNRVIYKFPLKGTPGLFTLTVPRGTNLFTAQLQGDEPVIWGIVDPDEKATVDIEVAAVWTGKPFTAPANAVFAHIGTVQLPTGIVVHYVLARPA